MNKKPHVCRKRELEDATHGLIRRNSSVYNVRSRGTSYGKSGSPDGRYLLFDASYKMPGMLINYCPFCGGDLT